MKANQIYSLIQKTILGYIRYIDGVLIACDTAVRVTDTGNFIIHTMHILIINT